MRAHYLILLGAPLYTQGSWGQEPGRFTCSILGPLQGGILQNNVAWIRE